MAYGIELAQRVRDYLRNVPNVTIEEKKMFGGLAFLVNGKMCINVTGVGLMCRYDKQQARAIAKRLGYRPMIMNGKNLPGYCYVSPEGFVNPDDFSFWVELCLAFNEKAKAAKRPSRKNHK
ncbi:RNA methyltransferase [Parapedobacter pyrenivorans]|uniref:RNA methyltransferase n=1 Tax=Parapedobacter pyrenivorans TaxID=1305674 RepID=A0A917HXC5_9SPHI|nr:TfoX/Sxy family protein [Parapedobacter pyrenivorans]GGG95684.1 RNA methyltransferase [Parapedobacter pyrenivorans]